MNFYREAFPEATVLPKMHFLEEHVVPWLKKWKIGFGLMGEQGAESIHAYFTYHTALYLTQYREWSTLCESISCTLHQPMSTPNLLSREGNSTKKSNYYDMIFQVTCLLKENV